MPGADWNGQASYYFLVCVLLADLCKNWFLYVTFHPFLFLFLENTREREEGEKRGEKPCCLLSFSL